MVAPVLIIAGRPITLLLHASRGRGHRYAIRFVRSRFVSVVTFPLFGLAAYAATVAGTHLTGFMDLTAQHQVIHDSEHLLYLFVGLCFFAPLIGNEPLHWRLSRPLRFLVLFVAMPVDTLTGLVLYQAGKPMFSSYAVERGWGPDPVTDLHWGGGVMWVGGDGFMVMIVMLVLFAWLRRGDERGGLGRWLEGVRRSTFDERISETGHASVSGGSTVDDDAALAAYNAHLARLHEPVATTPPSDSD
jgi:putative copper resistance protein D